MAKVGTVSCPEVIESTYNNGQPQNKICGLLVDVDLTNGEYTTVCENGHKHSLSQEFVNEFVTLD